MCAAETSAESQPINPLSQTWPPFLDLLYDHPERAFEEFFVWASKVLAVCPPRPLRQIHGMDREDLIHDIILHCCSDEFRRIKRYRDRGKPFAAWFLLVARNKVLDHLRTSRDAANVPLAEEDDENPGVPIPATSPLPDTLVDHGRILEYVQKTLRDMSDQCRILLQGAAEGCQPRELTKLLGWPDNLNKKVGDALRECRRTLKRRLRKEGLGPAELRGQFSE